MPSLNWIGKEKIVNHDKDVPFRLLRKNKKYSLGKSENLIVEGDNLEALKALMPFYYGKIKCIYIDPPYNTGNEKWVYNDRVNAPKIKEWLGRVVGPEGEDLCRHDKWLCMMYPRLKLLYDLLADDGVIFISIDDNEFHNLRIIMNEIFGPQNFVGVLKWKKKKQPSFLHGQLSSVTEYIIVFAKDIKRLGKLSLEKIAGDTKPLFNANNKEAIRFFPKGIRANFEKGKISKGRIQIRTSILRYLDEVVVKNGRTTNSFRLRARFRDGQENINYYSKKDLIFITSNYTLRRNVSEEESRKKKTITDLLLDWGQNQDAFDELYNIFGRKVVFENPKPSLLIKNIIKSSTDQNNTILDSFAGSGTTAHAVLDLNKEDGGNRKFILVEIEKNIAKNITAERIKRVARGYSYKTSNGKVVKVAGLGGGFEYIELGKPLFDKDGMIDEEVSFNDLASYIYFTETHTNLEKSKIRKNYLGEHNDVHYFLLFDGVPKKNILNRKLLKEIKKKDGKKVVYADKCLIDEDVLEKYQIIFKQIPYQVKTY